MALFLGKWCERKQRRRARLSGVGDDAPANVDKAFCLIIGSAMVGSNLTGLANNNNDYLDFGGFIVYKFGGVVAVLISVFVSKGVVDFVKVTLVVYLRQWGTVYQPRSGSRCCLVASAAWRRRFVASSWLARVISSSSCRAGVVPGDPYAQRQQ